MNYRELKNIIFDFDGVILDSVSAKTKAFYQMYLKYGKDIAENVKNFHIQNGGVSRYDKFKIWHKKYLNIKLSKSELDKLADTFSALVLEKVLKSEEIDGAKKFIKNYSDKFNFWIISGTPDKEINYIIKELGLRKYFIDVYGSPKNKIEWCRLIIKKNKIKSSETIFLGDAMSDYNAATKFKFSFF